MAIELTSIEQKGCFPNSAWHLKHKLKEGATLEQRIEWHIEHARRCPCQLDDLDILQELERRLEGKQQDFWIHHNIDDHRALGIWAAAIAERLLPYFEECYPSDSRPREAIEALRDWVKTGKFSMPVIRKASLGAHAAAKLIPEKDKAAIFAAHAVGQAAGTAHVPTHAIGTVLYSIKLVAFTNPKDVKAAVARERDWQTRILPQNLQGWVDSWVNRTQQLLPKALRAELE
jgi:hypothetical protein